MSLPYAPGTLVLFCSKQQGGSMPRIILKHSASDMPLQSQDQAILNTLVFTALCTQEIFSMLNKVNVTRREDALQVALKEAFTRGLVDDEGNK